MPDGIDTQSSPNRDNTPGLKAAPCPAMKHKQATWREKTARVRVSRSHWQQELRVLEFPDDKPAVLAMFLETKGKHEDFFQGMRNGYGDAIRRTGLVLQSWFCRAPNTLVTPRRWGVKAEPPSTTPGFTLKKRVWEGALAAR